MSFNFGPTLLSWMERHHPKLLAAVIEADRLSMERFDGHGSAMAQAFSHMIMPLASRRDKITQVRWGVADFRRRFGRDPEGMWLPETAVDLETLTILADAGIRFTVLAPRQAAKTRRLGETDWLDVSEGRVDPTTPYLVPLPGGRTFTVFFYDGPIAQDLAFGDMLAKGETFRERLMASFSGEGRDWPQIVHIATDGETYGHHHTYGEMTLSYCLSLIEADPTVELINYPAYLDRHPPAHEAEIFENSSWSCIHGVERWRADCGCNSGGNGTGTKSGARRSGKPWTGCATVAWRFMSGSPRNTSRIFGRLGTLTSTSSTIVPRRMSRRFSPSGKCVNYPQRT